MSDQYSPMSSQQEHNEELENEEITKMLEKLANKKTQEIKVLKKSQDSSEDE